MRQKSILAVSIALALATACADKQAPPTASSGKAMTEKEQPGPAKTIEGNPGAQRPVFRRLGSRVLPWNESAATKFQPPGFEQVARGPSAVCLDSEGRPLILNAVGSALARLDRTLNVDKVLTQVAPDFEDITCAEGAVVLFSPLRALAEVRTENGALRARITLPRAIRRVVSVDMTGGNLWLSTALQERWLVSRSLEPLALPAVQRTKQEGFALPDGRALQVLVRDGLAHLLVLSTGSTNRKRTSQRVSGRFSLPQHWDAVRPIWADRDRVCLLAERKKQDSRGVIRVERSMECLNLDDGTPVASLRLPNPGIYAPRRWLAMRDGLLVSMVPTHAGLELELWKLEVAR